MTKIILTGPSSCGKSTLCREFLKMGFKTTDETARDVINETDEDVPLRQNIMLYEQIKKESSDDTKGLSFYDRGVVDYMAFSDALGVRLNPKLVRTAKVLARQYDYVFFLDSCRFNIDGSRIEHSIEEAKYLSDAVFKKYQSFGYNPILIPVCETPQIRAELVLNSLEDILKR